MVAKPITKLEIDYHRFNVAKILMVAKPVARKDLVKLSFNVAKILMVAKHTLADTFIGVMF